MNDFKLAVRQLLQAAGKVGHFVLANGQDDQAVPGMTEGSLGQAQIAREERRMGKCQQKGKYGVVGHALATQLQTDLTNREAPASQQQALALQDVLIKDVHIPKLHGQLMGVFSERLPRCTHCLHDGSLRG